MSGMIPLCDAETCVAAGCSPTVCTGAGVPSSQTLFERSCAAIPGGVNSSIRAFRSVGGEPYVVARADGASIIDIEGTTYLDLVQSYGAVILGHAHPAITAAVSTAASDGTSFGAPTPREMKLAEAIAERVPSCERVRLDELGHRGDEHGDPPCSRRHGARPDRHLCRQLPRCHRRLTRGRRER